MASPKNPKNPSSLPVLSFEGTFTSYTSGKGTEYKVIPTNNVLLNGVPHRLFTSTEYPEVSLPDGRVTKARVDVIRLMEVKASAPTESKTFVAGKSPAPKAESESDDRLDKLEAMMTALVQKLTPAK
jgi:hypothetical protein